MIHWVMTAPNPNVIEHGWGNAQGGWRFHAVEAPTEATFTSIRYVRSLCGLLGRYGWGMDLYADEEDHCAVCQRKAGLPPTERTLARQRVRMNSKSASVVLAVDSSWSTPKSISAIPSESSKALSEARVLYQDTTKHD